MTEERAKNALFVPIATRLTRSIQQALILMDEREPEFGMLCEIEGFVSSFIRLHTCHSPLTCDECHAGWITRPFTRLYEPPLEYYERIAELAFIDEDADLVTRLLALSMEISLFRHLLRGDLAHDCIYYSSRVFAMLEMTASRFPWRLVNARLERASQTKREEPSHDKPASQQV